MRDFVPPAIARWSTLPLAMVLLGCAATAPSDDTATARDSLIAAERAFAAMSVADGVRAAFIANFADDGVIFAPHPRNARQHFASRPAPPDPRAIRLEWEPAIAAVAASADLGFTTGPYRLTDTTGARAPQHGVFFSIWRRDATGRWAVALDAGIGTPAAVAPADLAPGPVLAPLNSPLDGERLRGDGPETAGMTLPIGTGESDDYAALFAVDGRLQRNGVAPQIGRQRVAAYLRRPGAAPARAAFLPQGGGMASSGDLAWAYGALRTTGAVPGTTPLPNGWYVHLWARDATGRWRIAVAVILDAVEEP